MRWLLYSTEDPTCGFLCEKVDGLKIGIQNREFKRRHLTTRPKGVIRSGWAYARYSVITTLDDLGQVGDFLPSGLTSNESQLCLYSKCPFVGRKNARCTGKIMEKSNVSISYGFAGRCSHAYLVGLDQIQRDLGVVSSTCQPTAHA